VAFGAKDWGLFVVSGNPGQGNVTLSSPGAGGTSTLWLPMTAADNGKQFDISIYAVDSNGNPITGSASSGSSKSSTSAGSGTSGTPGAPLIEVQSGSTFNWNGGVNSTFTRSAANVVSGTGGAGALVNFVGGNFRVAVSAWTSQRATQVAGGTPNCVLYVDSNGNPATSSQFTFDPNASLVIQTSATQPFVVRQKGGTPGTNDLQIYYDGNDASYNSLHFGHKFYNTNGTLALQIASGPTGVVAKGYLEADVDANFIRCFGAWGLSHVSGTNVATVTNATSGVGWLQNSAGRARLTADVTESAGTLTNLTDLTLTLIAGRKYTGRMVVKCVNSVATEGVQFDFNGGTATMTNFWAGAGILASGGSDVVGTNISTSLAGAINFTTFTGESVVIIEVSLVCNAGGTFIPRAAENTHAAGTATFRLGSYLFMEDSPN
jgi:hypothetical protein